MPDRDCSQAVPQLFPLPEASCAFPYILFLTQKLSHIGLQWGAGAEKLSCSFRNSKENKYMAG